MSAHFLPAVPGAPSFFVDNIHLRAPLPFLYRSADGRNDVDIIMTSAVGELAFEVTEAEFHLSPPSPP